MDDLSQRDLSQIPDEQLSPEERRELKRRFDDFVERLRERAGTAPARKPEKKPRKRPRRVARWDPSKGARGA